jgi:hypothetical protein
MTAPTMAAAVSPARVVAEGLRDGAGTVSRCTVVLRAAVRSGRVPVRGGLQADEAGRGLVGDALEWPGQGKSGAVHPQNQAVQCGPDLGGQPGRGLVR